MILVVGSFKLNWLYLNYKINFYYFVLVGDVSFVVVYSDEKDKSRGCGTVEFDRVESAQKAIDKMHRFDINGRKLVVKEVYNIWSNYTMIFN